MTLYEKALAVSKPYLGPAAENFLTRQCKTHLQIDPPALAPSHLSVLAKWVGLGADLIMDKAQAAEFSRKIQTLA